MISTASSESSSRTTSVICSFGIDSRISLRTVSSTSVSATQSKSWPMRRDELVALLRLERLQHVAEVGFVQVADEAAQRLAVMALDRVGDLLDEIGVEDALLVADAGGLGFRVFVAVSVSTVFLQFSRAEWGHDPLARVHRQEKTWNLVSLAECRSNCDQVVCRRGSCENRDCAGTPQSGGAAMASPRIERRLSAILAADVVGYSRLMEADEAVTLAAIKRLREQLLNPLLAEHKGRIVKLMGDGAIVEFASVVDAVTCAVALQKGVTVDQAEIPPDRRIAFRIGINLGDVVVEGERSVRGRGQCGGAARSAGRARRHLHQRCGAETAGWARPISRSQMSASNN